MRENDETTCPVCEQAEGFTPDHAGGARCQWCDSPRPKPTRCADCGAPSSVGRCYPCRVELQRWQETLRAYARRNGMEEADSWRFTVWAQFRGGRVDELADEYEATGRAEATREALARGARVAVALRE